MHIELAKNEKKNIWSMIMLYANYFIITNEITNQLMQKSKYPLTTTSLILLLVI